MIFVTVGTQLPFDRLTRTVDEWAGSTGRDDVFAQIGPAEHQPKHIRFTDFIEADECRRFTEQASVVIAHAGMGSIITALELGKPILVMPRRKDLGEHRNDHQLATAKQLLRQGRIVVAFDEHQLLEKLHMLDRLRAPDRISTHARPQLLESIAAYVDYGVLPAPMADEFVPEEVALERPLAEHEHQPHLPELDLEAASATLQ